MRSFLVTAAVLLPQCLALAVDTTRDPSTSAGAAPVVGFPEYEDDIFWGDKHRRVRDEYNGFAPNIEHMIRDLGIYDEPIQKRDEPAANVTSTIFVPPGTTTAPRGNTTVNVLAKSRTTMKTSTKKSTTEKLTTKTSTTKKSTTKQSTTKTSTTKTKSSTTTTKKSSTAKSTTNKSTAKTTKTTAKTTRTTSAKSTKSSAVGAVDNKVATSTYPDDAAQRSAIITPSVLTYTLLGAPTHNPVLSYISGQTKVSVPSMTESLTPVATVEGLLAEKPINSNTGNLVVNAANKGNIAPLNYKPSYSRDQGKGGTIGDQSFFVFADSLSYTPAKGDTPGNFTGAASNSVALDKGKNPANGKSLQLQDPIGAYSGPGGALRTFVPMTQGETFFGTEFGRIAIWPESSIIPLTGTSAIQYAPIVMSNKTGFYYAGTTMYEITIPGQGGPVANRVATRLFDTSSGVEWGCLGGLRSYGPSGSTGGNVYIVGGHKGGLMLGRVPVDQVADASAYTYWQGNETGWTGDQPNKLSTTNTFLPGTFSTVDIFYSPRHLTFIAVYFDQYVDNDFYWRYLDADKPILPSWAGGGDDDIAELLVQYSWAKAQLLFQTPPPSKSYNYGGGLNKGYFGANDITNGGDQMLLHWDHPTNLAAGSAETGFDFASAVVTWS